MSTRSIQRFLKQALDSIYYLKDDQFAAKCFDQFMSPNIRVKINLDDHDFSSYRNIIMSARQSYNMTEETNDELLKSEDEEGKDGVIANHSIVLNKDKMTGREFKTTFCIITRIQEVNGQQMITEITEVVR